MYSKAMSVMRGHHDKSKERNFLKFSEINSIPSSVIFVQPAKLNTVKLGSEWTETKLKQFNLALSVVKYGSYVVCTKWMVKHH